MLCAAFKNSCRYFKNNTTTSPWAYLHCHQQQTTSSFIFTSPPPVAATSPASDHIASQPAFLSAAFLPTSPTSVLSHTPYTFAFCFPHNRCWCCWQNLFLAIENRTIFAIWVFGLFWPDLRIDSEDLLVWNYENLAMHIFSPEMWTSCGECISLITEVWKWEPERKRVMHANTFPLFFSKFLSNYFTSPSLHSLGKQ